MNLQKNHGASAYANIGLETGVASASPHGLILMLFDGAMQSIVNADRKMGTGDTAGKGKAIAKAIEIINHGLNASLDETVGGDLTQSLKALYDYMCRRLVTANFSNDAAILMEVRKLLSELREAWAAIGGNADKSRQTATDEPATEGTVRRFTA